MSVISNMLAKDKPPFSTMYASHLRPIVSEEKDKMLSIASIQEISKFVPNIDIESNYDLLPVAFDACVINRGNKNGDISDTEAGLAIYKTFVNKFIDTEHNRGKVIGVILTSSLTEFGTGRLLSEAEVIGTKEPFVITLGGVLWKGVNQDLCNLVEESNDSTSENYLAVSASWELGFTDYKVVELEQGAKNLSEGRIISDPETIHSIKPYLKCNKGSGVKNGKSYYRMPCENVVAMGIGLTENPAADVKGVAVNTEAEAPAVTVSSKAETVVATEKVVENAENISHEQKLVVKEEREHKIMKITSIDQINDETLKQCTASVITEFISTELKKASDQFTAEKEAQASANTKLQASTDALKATIDQMKASLDALTQEKESRAKLDAFNTRMAETVASYEFPDDVAKIVVSDLKSISSEEAYASWKQKAETLFKPYNKVALAAAAKAKADTEAADKAKAAQEAEAAAKAKAAKADDEDGDADAKAKAAKAAKDDKADKKDDKKDDKKEAKASEAVASAVEEVLDNAEQKKGGLPNSSSADKTSLKDRFATAFAEEGFLIKK